MPKRPIPRSISSLPARACSANVVAPEWCRGGYNVALRPGDSVERHFMDTIEGGKWLCDQDLAWTLVAKAIERIAELENEIGCFFDRNPDGTLHGKAFAGQTFDRTAHKGDLTGIEIVNRLIEQVWTRPAIRRLEEHRAMALVPSRDGASIAGVLFIDIRTGAFRFIEAQAVLLATGAGPTMYAITHPRATRAWTDSRWRSASGCRCATWRWSSFTRPACSRVPTRA
jgi:fumarate reductase flavoprotein subunit